VTIHRTGGATTGAGAGPVGLERPPGAIFLAAACITAAVALEASSRDGLLGMVASVWAGLGLLAAWLVRLVFLAAPAARTHARWRFRWLLPLVILAGAVGLIALDIPARLRFEASRTALDQMVSEVTTGGSIERTSVGLYPIEALERTADGVRFLIAGCGFIGQCGFAYSADGDPAEPDSGDIYPPLGGGWFIWIQPF
jgi:hypothetical protein